MLKDYFESFGRSVYSIARDSKVPYSTLNDLANGKVRVSECKAGMIRKVADTLGISMDELYSRAENDTDQHFVMTSYEIPVNIEIRHKAYQAEFDYDGERVMIELCKVSAPSTFYIEDIAKWRAEEYIRDKRMHGDNDRTMPGGVR